MSDRIAEATRRETLQLGLAVGTGMIAAAAIPALVRIGEAFAQAETDAGILQAAIGLEHTAVVTYETATGSGLLDRETMAIATLFGRHEQEHLDTLIAAFERLGGQAPEPLEPEDIDGLGDVVNQNDLLNFALELETMAVAQYYDAHQKLEDPDLLKTAASVMGNEGQHLVVLRRALGHERLPNAFETGEASQ